jgi:hypothetical protein
MSDAVIIKTRKFKRNPLLSRKQVCFSFFAAFHFVGSDAIVDLRELTLDSWFDIEWTI